MHVSPMLFGLLVTPSIYSWQNVRGILRMHPSLAFAAKLPLHFSPQEPSFGFFCLTELSFKQVFVGCFSGSLQENTTFRML